MLDLIFKKGEYKMKNGLTELIDDLAILITESQEKKLYTVRIWAENLTMIDMQLTKKEYLAIAELAHFYNKANVTHGSSVAIEIKKK